jgi:hypothetical protein
LNQHGPPVGDGGFVGEVCDRLSSLARHSSAKTDLDIRIILYEVRTGKSAARVV